jgi:hypothetical protein
MALWAAILPPCLKKSAARGNKMGADRNRTVEGDFRHFLKSTAKDTATSSGAPRLEFSDSAHGESLANAAVRLRMKFLKWRELLPPPRCRAWSHANHGRCGRYPPPYRTPSASTLSRKVSHHCTAPWSVLHATASGKHTLPTSAKRRAWQGQAHCLDWPASSSWRRAATKPCVAGASESP